MSKVIAETLNRLLPQAADLTAALSQADVQDLTAAFDRTRLWCRYLVDHYADEDASAVLHALYSSMTEVCILAPLGLYNAAYAALRRILDLAISFSYYVSHPVELHTVVSTGNSWVGRSGALEWHMEFTPNFRAAADALNVMAAWKEEYSKLSLFVHSIPGPSWKSLRDMKPWTFSAAKYNAVVEEAIVVDGLINKLWLAVFTRDMAGMNAADAKKVTANLDKAKLRAAGLEV